jgi:hypothetical protein
MFHFKKGVNRESKKNGLGLKANSYTGGIQDYGSLRFIRDDRLYESSVIRRSGSTAHVNGV